MEDDIEDSRGDWPWILIGVISIAILAVGLYLGAPNKDKSEVLVALLTALGTTGFAAALISGLVGRGDRKVVRQERERYLDELVGKHDAHLEEVEKSVFEAVLRSTIGVEVVNEVKKQVFDQPYLRKDFHLVVELEAVDGRPEVVNVSVEMSYRLLNLANNEQNIEIRHSLDDPAGDHSADFYRVELRRDGSETECLEGDALRPHVSWHQAATVFTKNYDLGPREEVFVKVTGAKHQRRSDQYVWHSYSLVEGFKCTIRTPKSLGVTMFQELLYPEGYRQVPANVGSGGEIQEWNIRDGVLLMYQGVQLRWVPSATVPLAAAELA